MCLDFAKEQFDFANLGDEFKIREDKLEVEQFLLFRNQKEMTLREHFRFKLR